MIKKMASFQHFDTVRSLLINIFKEIIKHEIRSI
jgi:hypothetical protein